MPEIENKLLDKRRLDAMKVKILELEKENLKIRDKTNDEMVEAIKKIISQEINRNY